MKGTTKFVHALVEVECSRCGNKCNRLHPVPITYDGRVCIEVEVEFTHPVPITYDGRVCIEVEVEFTNPVLCNNCEQADRYADEVERIAESRRRWWRRAMKAEVKP